jgi:hypothetical protein
MDGSRGFEVPARCALECKGALLRALSGMLLEAVAQPDDEDASAEATSRAEATGDACSSSSGKGKGAGGESGSSRSSSSHGYQVSACVPEYARVPCPMYPPPGVDASAWEFTAAAGSPDPLRGIAEGFSHPATAASQAARRATLADKLRADLAEEARKPPRSSSNSGSSSISRSGSGSSTSEAVTFAAWAAAFAAGGANGCRGAKEYARLVGRGWCAAALDGPGGQATTHGVRSSKDSPTAPVTAPSGWWCALPQHGHWHN